MKLAVITVTCRQDPRFAEMARALFHSFRRAPPDTQLEWIVVDDRLWWDAPDQRLGPVRAAMERILTRQDEERVTIEHVAPPPNDHRGPDVSDPKPAWSSAANAGLAAVSLESPYVIFLSDCSIPTSDWFNVAIELAHRGIGWKCRQISVHDHVIPQDEPFRHSECWDSYHQVKPSTVAGPCWGVPREALIEVGGFDADYDGEDDLYHHEILERLGRAGITFVTTKRASVLRLGRTKSKDEITTRKDLLRAQRNRVYFNHLQQDRDRILPGAADASSRPPQPGRSAAQLPTRALVAPPPPRVAKPPPSLPGRAGAPAPRPAPAVPAAAPPAGDVPGDAATRPMTLHERATRTEAARRARAQAERDGTAPTPAGDDRCAYIPNQGTYKGSQCRLRARHGGVHQYEQAQALAPAPRPARPPLASREPPTPPSAVAFSLDILDRQAANIQAALAELPNTPARNAVMLAVVLRREGALVQQPEITEMLRDAISRSPVGAATAGRRDSEAAIAEAVEVELAMVREIMGALPPIAVTYERLEQLRDFAETMDRWRGQQGLPTRAGLSWYVRGYAAAGDIGIDVAVPDDYGDFAQDDLQQLERNAAATDDGIQSTAPLTDEEARQQAWAPVAEIARRTFWESKDASFSGSLLAGREPAEPPVTWETVERAVELEERGEALIVGEDRTEELRRCWPTRPPDVAAELPWGPTDDRPVAVAWPLR